MTPEIVAIFVALLIHIPLYFVLLIIIDVKKAGGSVSDAFPCLRVGINYNYLQIIIMFKMMSRIIQRPKGVALENGNPAVEQSVGDSDVQAESLRVQQLLQYPPTNPTETPVVLIQVWEKSKFYRRCRCFRI